MSFRRKEKLGFTIINDDDETDMIPIIAIEEEEELESADLPSSVAVLPLRNTVLFPGVVIPITVGRDKSIKLIKAAVKSKSMIAVVSQKDVNIEDPSVEDLFKMGTLAKIVKMVKLPDGNTTVIIQGKKRVKIVSETTTEPYLTAKVEYYTDIVPDSKDKEFKALISNMKDMAEQLVEMTPHLPPETSLAIKNIDSPSFLIHFIAFNLSIDLVERQNILEVDDLKQRTLLVLKHLSKEQQFVDLKNQIQNRVKTDLDKQQREYFLNQQLKTIQEELGGATPDLEVKSLRERGKKKKWNKEIREVFEKELDKLQRMNPAAADYSVVLNYAELLIELPWSEFTNDRFDLKKAQEILDHDHFGLDKVKDRILEYLAVLKLKADMKAPILCLVGPPGVGKTSLGKSIAKAIGRKYVRMSLGGVKDEAVIRGHRKTYIGAMPGRIIQSIKKAKTSNPVMVLDEIDKAGIDFRGDITSALLEVLDPEQNNSFNDHYLEVDYDLSRVMFIATANNAYDIPPALLDRMEVIHINGYTIEEKIQIAKKYLIPKQLKEHGLLTKDFKIDVIGIEKIATDYTRESGVRSLDKQVANLVRGIAKIKALDEPLPKKIDDEIITKILGIKQYDKDIYENNNVAGVVVGLAWTSAGGDILYIESSLSKGKGAFNLTGNLGQVMKESASIALAYMKSNADALKIDPKLFENTDLHIHVPEGATPKDGPSAGITMLTSLVSSYTQKMVKPFVAMTGEITLRGKVLPVGGIKEKILAAKRAGIKEIILSKLNKKDIDEIKPIYIADMTFTYVDEMMEVIQHAILDEKVNRAIDLSQFTQNAK